MRLERDIRCAPANPAMADINNQAAAGSGTGEGVASTTPPNARLRPSPCRVADHDSGDDSPGDGDKRCVSRYRLTPKRPLGGYISGRPPSVTHAGEQKACRIQRRALTPPVILLMQPSAKPVPMIIESEALQGLNSKLLPNERERPPCSIPKYGVPFADAWGPPVKCPSNTLPLI